MKSEGLGYALLQDELEITQSGAELDVEATQTEVIGAELRVEAVRAEPRTEVVEMKPRGKIAEAESKTGTTEAKSKTEVVKTEPARVRAILEEIRRRTREIPELIRLSRGAGASWMAVLLEIDGQRTDLPMYGCSEEMVERIVARVAKQGALTAEVKMYWSEYPALNMWSGCFYDVEYVNGVCVA